MQLTQDGYLIHHTYFTISNTVSKWIGKRHTQTKQKTKENLITYANMKKA